MTIEETRMVTREPKTWIKIQMLAERLGVAPTERKEGIVFQGPDGNWYSLEDILQATFDKLDEATQ